MTMSDEYRTVLARELGMKEREIFDAEDSPAGVVVNLTDGTSLVIVEDDNPDAEGKTGVMFLAAPITPDGKPYRGDFPVYAQPTDIEIVDLTAEDAGYPTDGNVGDVLGWVAGDADRAADALILEQARDKPRAGVTDELTAILAQHAEKG